MQAIIKTLVKVGLSGGVIVAAMWTLWLPYLTTQVQDIANWLSIALPLSYIVLFIIIDVCERKPSPSLSTKDDILGREYNILERSVGRRENSLLLSGSIFVTASALLLSQFSTSRVIWERLALVFGSWGLYSIWLFLFQLTAVRLTDATFSRLKGIEEKLDFQVHRYLSTKRDPARRWIWLWLLDALVVAGYLLLNLDVGFLRLTLSLQVVIVVLYSFLMSMTVPHAFKGRGALFSALERNLKLSNRVRFVLGTVAIVVAQFSSVGLNNYYNKVWTGTYLSYADWTIAVLIAVFTGSVIVVTIRLVFPWHLLLQKKDERSPVLGG